MKYSLWEANQANKEDDEAHSLEAKVQGQPLTGGTMYRLTNGTT